MKLKRAAGAILVLLIICFAIPARAADRMHAGLWVGSTVVAGKTFPTSSCISAKDADAMNGDAKAITAYLQTIIPPEMCAITNVKAEGSEVIYTASCMKAAPKVVTTSYHGTSSEGTDSTGAKTTAKLVGPCK